MKLFGIKRVWCTQNWDNCSQKLTIKDHNVILRWSLRSGADEEKSLAVIEKCVKLADQKLDQSAEAGNALTLDNVLCKLNISFTLNGAQACRASYEGERAFA